MTKKQSFGYKNYIFTLLGVLTAFFVVALVKILMLPLTNYLIGIVKNINTLFQSTLIFCVELIPIIVSVLLLFTMICIAMKRNPIKVMFGFY